MTRLEEGLRDLASEAPAPYNMAERALRTSRRTRNRVRIPSLAAATAAVVGVVAIAAIGLPAPTDDDGPIGSSTRTEIELPRNVRLPASAPDLPAEDVGPAAFAYVYGDMDDEGGGWRVMLADGEHFAVPDAAWPVDADPAGTRGELVVSPDGARLGYFRDDGTFVIRDLSSGTVTELFEWDPEVFTIGQQEAVWSADGRWLLVVPGPGYFDEGADQTPPENRLADPVLVDTVSRRTVELPDTYNVLMGMSNGDGLFPYLLDGAGKHPLPLFDHQGKQRDQIPAGLLPFQSNGNVQKYVEGGISPDGRTFAAITGASRDRNSAGKLRVIDLETDRVTHEHELGEWLASNGPMPYGWMDADTVLLRSVELEPIGDANDGYRTVATNFDAVDVETGQKTRLFGVRGEKGVVVSVAYQAVE